MFVVIFGQIFKLMKTQKTVQKERWIDRALAVIPRVMASRLSVFVFLFLFFYLVIYTLLCIVIPGLEGFMPDDRVQVVLGNYTNILSALGASIAAGSGVAIHSKVKGLHKRHDDLEESVRGLEDSVRDLHAKIDKLSSKL